MNITTFSRTCYNDSVRPDWPSSPAKEPCVFSLKAASLSSVQTNLDFPVRLLSTRARSCRFRDKITIVITTRESNKVHQKWRLFGGGLEQRTQKSCMPSRDFVITMGILSLNLQERAWVLNSLTGKSKFVWTLEREAAFNDLRFFLSSSMSSFSFLTCVSPLNSTMMRLTPVLVVPFPKGINSDGIVQFFMLQRNWVRVNWTGTSVIRKHLPSSLPAEISLLPRTFADCVHKSRSATLGQEAWVFVLGWPWWVALQSGQTACKSVSCS